MLLTESEGKHLLSEVGIPVPPGRSLSRPEDLALLDLPFPLALKAQVAGGGRGKAGGVRRCTDAAEAAEAFTEIMRARFAGEAPRAVLAEPWLPIARELYLAVAVDGSVGGYVVLYAPQGGMDVETGPPPLRCPVGLPRDFRAHALRRVLAGAEPDARLRERLVALARRLLRLAAARECLTVEINPLALLRDGALVAADAKLVRDDASAHRHADLAVALDRARRAEPEEVRRSAELGLLLVWLGGEVGLLSTGAGMTMAAMDAIDAAGGRPACFLDVSGNLTPAGLRHAVAVLDGNPDIRAILVSIFGGGTHVDRVARNLLDILGGRGPGKPVVLRLHGTGREDATRILADAGLANHETLESAVAEAVARARQAMR